MSWCIQNLTKGNLLSLESHCSPTLTQATKETRNGKEPYAWQTEGQDTFVVYTGTSVMLARSVRCIQSDWKSHLGFFIHFDAPTWRFKAGFGGRVIPTKRTVDPISASQQQPPGSNLAITVS